MYVLVACQGTDNSLFCKVGFSWNWISLYSFSIITSRILSCIACKNENTYLMITDISDWTQVQILHIDKKIIPWVTQSTNWPIRKETMWYVSYPVVATLHQFTFTMSNCNYRPLSRRDTQLNNHYTYLYINSLIKRFFCSYKIGYLCLK